MSRRLPVSQGAMTERVAKARARKPKTKRAPDPSELGPTSRGRECPTKRARKAPRRAPEILSWLVGKAHLPGPENYISE